MTESVILEKKRFCYVIKKCYICKSKKIVIMKKVLLIAVAAILFVGCSGSKKELTKEDVAKQHEERVSHNTGCIISALLYIESAKNERICMDKKWKIGFAKDAIEFIHDVNEPVKESNSVVLACLVEAESELQIADSLYDIYEGEYMNGKYRLFGFFASPREISYMKTNEHYIRCDIALKKAYAHCKELLSKYINEEPLVPSVILEAMPFEMKLYKDNYSIEDIYREEGYYNDYREEGYYNDYGEEGDYDGTYDLPY